MSTEDDATRETDAVAARYARRDVGSRYSLLRPDVWHTLQERQRAMLRLFVRLGFTDLSALRLLEVGCGSGGNLLELLRLGFAPDRLSGIELLTDRFAAARAALPVALSLHCGDALQVALPAASPPTPVLDPVRPRRRGCRSEWRQRGSGSWR